MTQNQECLDAINILKGIAYSQLMLQDKRVVLCQSNNINFIQIFDQIDRKHINKIYSVDLIKFMSVYRIAISQRQGQYIIYLSGSQNPYMVFDDFKCYFSNGDRVDISDMMTKSQTYNHGKYADEIIKNYGEFQIAKMIQKQIQFYRTIQKLKEEFVKKYGLSFKNVIGWIDREKRGKIDRNNLIEFIHQYGVQFSTQEFQAIGRRIFSKQQTQLSYKQMMRLFSPFEPLNFPIYRKQNNFQKALDYINKQITKLNINNLQLPYNIQLKNKQGNQNLNHMIQNYRNNSLKIDNINQKYFYDQNYYNQLKQYRTNFFNPNRDIKKKLQTKIIGPQYHDHFFSDYYLYLEEKSKLQHYYNKFGKKYTFDNQS